MTQNLRLSIVAEGTVGGLARQLELIAEALPQRGFDLHFVVSCERDPSYNTQVAAFREAGHTVDVLAMCRSISPRQDLCSLNQVREALATRRPDLVHTHCSKGGILGRRAAYQLGIPAVHTPHVFSFEWEKNIIKRTLYRLIERKAAKWCSRIVMLSELQRRRTLAAGIAAKDKLQIIPNGVSPETYAPATPDQKATAREHFKIPPGTPLIGVAARLEPQKGMGNFLRAARKIHQEVPEAKFLIAGTGSLEDECRRRAAELGIRESVIFYGNIVHMQQFYHAIDCFMLASLWEGLPYVVLEAMASGVPVVSTTSFGCDTVIDNEVTGLIVEIDDQEGLATAALRVLSDNHFAGRIGAAGRARVQQQFTLDHWADSLAACYREVAKPEKVPK